MNKWLYTLVALVVSAQLAAYEIEIENDTDSATFEVQMSFFKNQFPSQKFTLAPQQQRTFNIPDGVPLTKPGIRVRKVTTGKGKRKVAGYMPKKVAGKVDIEIKLDDYGNIMFGGELF